jgi:uncharacterized protein (TIGR03086 family)
MTEQEVFVSADRALVNVIKQIKDGQWSMQKPDWFQTGGQGDADLRTIVNYHAYDDAWVPDVLAGKTKDEVGAKHDGDLLGTDPKASFAQIADTAMAAAQALDDPDKVVHLSYGDFPAREYLLHITSFRGVRVYDIAKWIGIDTTMPADLVQGMWDMLAPHADEWRAMGVFGPKIVVGEDVNLQTKLLALCGRPA